MLDKQGCVSKSRGLGFLLALHVVRTSWCGTKVLLADHGVLPPTHELESGSFPTLFYRRGSRRSVKLCGLSKVTQPLSG